MHFNFLMSFEFGKVLRDRRWILALTFSKGFGFAFLRSVSTLRDRRRVVALFDFAFFFLRLTDSGENT